MCVAFYGKVNAISDEYLNEMNHLVYNCLHYIVLWGEVLAACVEKYGSYSNASNCIQSISTTMKSGRVFMAAAKLSQQSESVDLIVKGKR